MKYILCENQKIGQVLQIFLCPRDDAVIFCKSKSEKTVNSTIKCIDL